MRQVMQHHSRQSRIRVGVTLHVRLVEYSIQVEDLRSISERSPLTQNFLTFADCTWTCRCEGSWTRGGLLCTAEKARDVKKRGISCNNPCCGQACAFHRGAHKPTVAHDHAIHTIFLGTLKVISIHLTVYFTTSLYTDYTGSRMAHIREQYSFLDFDNYWPLECAQKRLESAASTPLRAASRWTDFWGPGSHQGSSMHFYALFATSFFIANRKAAKLPKEAILPGFFPAGWKQYIPLMATWLRGHH